MKIGDLVRHQSHTTVGVIVSVYNHKIWRTSELGKKVNWNEVDPEPFADVLWDNTIRKIPQADLELVNA
jgi:hypothetical protein